MMIESPERRAGLPPGGAGQGPRSAGWPPWSRLGARDSVHDGHPGRHRRDPGRPAEALSAIAASHRRWGHVQEVIVQNFLPKPGTAMHDGRRLPGRRLLWSIAAARVILPPEVHLQAPPNLSDDFAELLRPVSTTGAGCRR